MRLVHAVKGVVDRQDHWDRPRLKNLILHTRGYVFENYQELVAGGYRIDLRLR